MKRKEEIVTQAVKEKSQLHQPLEWGAGFISGAEWADKTMLDRACDWLAKHISPEEIYDDETNEMPTTYLTVNLHNNMLDFINDFRRAMKGGAE